MRSIIGWGWGLWWLGAAAVCAQEAPVAALRPQPLEAHGEVRVDEYYWLRDRDDPEVLAYLQAENAYLQERLAHTAGLQEELFAEIVGRLDPREDSALVPDHGAWYYHRFEEGREYAVHCRRLGSPDAPDEVLLDENELDDGGYLAVRGLQVDSAGRFLVYAVDREGRRKYTLRFKDLATGEHLPEAILDVTGNTVWAEDGRTLFYTRQDPVTLRPWQVWRHELGDDPAADALVYEEADETFAVGVTRSKSRQYLFIVCDQTLASEVRFVPADRPAEPWRVLQPRQRGLEYSVEHLGGFFYLRTNHEAQNFRLLKTPCEATSLENWTEVVPHRPDVLLEDFDVFADFLVLKEGSQALSRLRVIRWDGADDHYLDAGEDVYTIGLGDNREIDAAQLRYEYSSLTTPQSTYDYDPAARQGRLVHRRRVLGDFEPADYRTERLWATAPDGARVPISLVCARDLPRDGSAPLLLYAYGSYGYSTRPWFNAARLSLLERGFVYAIAHVRGGQEMGRVWYEDGKLLKKMNTFTDFIACAEHLVAQRYTAPDRLFAQGGSAGGLLMGVIVNLRPELFRGVVADVPFVDVVTTMLDDSIPLTTGEYDEWGNPHDPEYYRYLLSYSPYDQVREQAYPNLLVTAGLHDSQVQYWEPAKWVARLRARHRGDNLILLKTNLEAGHGGESGRYRQYRETALGYAFLLDLAGRAAAE